jgi:hypothetical protein
MCHAEKGEEFEKTETGGGCLPGCRQLKKYDRVEPIQNL